MGHVLPDRLFWAEPEDDDDDGEDPDTPPDFALPPHDTRH
jgi:hydroxymethylpyrimidine/phosphomethylpyrimidine kinase